MPNYIFFYLFYFECYFFQFLLYVFFLSNFPRKHSMIFALLFCNLLYYFQILVFFTFMFCIIFFYNFQHYITLPIQLTYAPCLFECNYDLKSDSKHRNTDFYAHFYPLYQDIFHTGVRFAFVLVFCQRFNAVFGVKF